MSSAGVTSPYQALVDQGWSPDDIAALGITPDTPASPGTPSPDQTPAPGSSGTVTPPLDGGTTPADTAGQRDALAYLNQQLIAWGFNDSERSGLSDWMWDELTHGRSKEEVGLDTYTRPEFKSRFPAIFELQKKGLPPLAPQDVIKIEGEMSQTAQANNLPAGFYDNRADFQRLIGDGWSSKEFTEIVQQGFDKVSSQAPKEVRDWFTQAYGVQGDAALAAMFLDDQKAIPILEQHARAAEIGGRSAAAGFTIGRQVGESAAGLGITDYQLGQGLNQAEAQRGLLTETAGEQLDLTDENAVAAALGLSSQASEDLRKRQADRLAEFSGGGGSMLTRQGFSGLGGAESNQ